MLGGSIMKRGIVQRLLTETDKRLLWKFIYLFGYQGMRSIQRFQRRIEHGIHFPAFLFISVTNACNLSCQGCWVSPSSPPKELPPQTLDNLIRESKRHGVRFFGILGGEPLLYEPLFRVLESHPDCYFLLFTNGTLITEAVAGTLRKLGNISPLISIEGLETVSDIRRGGEQVFSATMEGLARCRAHRLVTGVAVSVCRSNRDDLACASFVERIAAEGAHYLWYTIYRPVGPKPTPELTLDPDEITELRRFIVDIRTKAPLIVVDAYWNHLGEALCPAATGIAYHIHPEGWIEPCPPLQFACDSIGDGTGIYDIIRNSDMLARFRTLCRETTRGCILMEHPDLLADWIRDRQARDTTGRETLLQELQAMHPCISHHQPGSEIPERNPAYRFAKKHWFFGFGAYG